VQPLVPVYSPIVTKVSALGPNELAPGRQITPVNVELGALLGVRGNREAANASSMRGRRHHPWPCRVITLGHVGSSPLAMSGHRPGGLPADLFQETVSGSPTGR
jgi:hypothetical protein